MRRDRTTMQQAKRDYHSTHKRKLRVMPWRVWMLRSNISVTGPGAAAIQGEKNDE